MTLTTDDVILITEALRQKATTLAELAAKPYGSKAYREGLGVLATHYKRLTDAFTHHTHVTLTNHPTKGADR